MWSTRRRDPRIRDEIVFHRDRLIDDYVAGGMDRKEAERRAFLEFGNPAPIEESVTRRTRTLARGSRKRPALRGADAVA